MRKLIHLSLFCLAFCQPVFASSPTKTLSSWFISAGGGVAFPSFGHTLLTVPNNSGFPVPFNQDTYTVHQNPQPLVTLSLGKRWEKDKRWFPAYALSVDYQHFFSSNMGNQIIQYSAPDFTNYQYNWNLASDVFLIGAKLNLFRSGPWLPYITAGLGCAINTSGGYSESALPGLTDTRVSAGYQSNTRFQPAYNIGAGFDYKISRILLISAEYQFQDLGNTSLGHGSGTWANESLNLGRIRNNAALVKLTYLIK